MRDGVSVRVRSGGGAPTARYRQGFVFLNLEDETGLVNVCASPIFHRCG